MAITLNRIQCKTQSASSFEEARELILSVAKAARDAGRHDKLIVELDGGQYSLNRPFVLSAKENPELLSLEITLRGKFPSGTTVQSFGHVFGKELTPVVGKPGHYTYDFPADENGKYPVFRELLVNGYLPLKNAKSPTWKNPFPLTADERSGEKKRKGLYVPLPIATQLKEGGIGACELLMCIEWEYAVLHVKDVLLDDTVDVKGEPYALVTFLDGEMDFLCEKCIAILNIGQRVTLFRNSPAFLNEINSYTYDHRTGRLSLILPEDMSINRFAVEYARLENLISVEGLENFTLENLAFTGVTSKHMSEHACIGGQANSLRGIGRLRHAAVLAEDTRNFTVKSCSFNAVGGNGVQSVNTSSGFTVKDCKFRNIGASGVTVGNPSYKWDDPKNRTRATRIENNYFENVAYDAPAAPCIYSGMVDGIKILHNTVEGCSYSSVSVGWGWDVKSYELGEQFNVRDAEIAYNYFHNFMSLLRDGGAIYVLGGNANPKTTPERFNRMHHNYAELDELVWNGAKYGYYCDGASSNWDVSDSVVINVDGMPIFSQPHPGALSYHNTFRNIYSTTQRHKSAHVPERDVITLDYHLVEEGADALFAKHPEVKAIRDAAGSTLMV